MTTPQAYGGEQGLPVHDDEVMAAHGSEPSPVAHVAHGAAPPPDGDGHTVADGTSAGS